MSRITMMYTNERGSMHLLTVSVAPACEQISARRIVYPTEVDGDPELPMWASEEHERICVAALELVESTSEIIAA